ncbi:hypothetical protein SVAN01_04374 [Stagonosporopsis vannaccii]|nr:hypothetical protein SVAN01_04374 [Stagonosporopsis vannaccii]
MRIRALTFAPGRSDAANEASQRALDCKKGAEMGQSLIRRECYTGTVVKPSTGGAERSMRHVFVPVAGASTTFALALTHRARPCFSPTFLFARLYASHGHAGRVQLL